MVTRPPVGPIYAPAPVFIPVRTSTGKIQLRVQYRKLCRCCSAAVGAAHGDTCPNRSAEQG
jgi:hypothetical protein